jgi:tetratricopeptide (TPR) repeat protein
MTDLADLYKARGRYAESESLYKEALRADRRVFGDDHPQTLHTMADLAVLYGREKRWPEEEGLLLETIERLRRTLGETHENTLTSMNDLACVYVAEGRHAEARTLFLKTLDGQRRSLGEDHPDTLLTLYNLGCLEARDGNRRAAFERLNEAVAHGFARPDEMRQDSDLESLHGDPRFAALIARAREQSQARTKSKPAAGG